jgi:hypothetical protein
MPTRHEIFRALISSIRRSGRTPRDPRHPDQSGENYIINQIQEVAAEYDRENDIPRYGQESFNYSPEQSAGLLDIMLRILWNKPSRGHNMRKAGLTPEVIDETIQILQGPPES